MNAFRWAALAAVLLATSTLGAATKPPHQARSVHLNYGAPPACVFYNEVTVERSTRGSYFQVCGFSQGYFGIQELGNGKKVVLFSVWDPGNAFDFKANPNSTPQDRRVETLYQADDVAIHRFGGEGTGNQCMFKYDWQLQTTYRFCIRGSTEAKKTTYDAYFFINETKTWKRLATFRTPSRGQLLASYYSFIEDFRRDGKSLHEVRRARFTNGWILTAKHEWRPLLKAIFTADGTPVDNYDAGLVDGGFYLQTGGDTRNTRKIHSIIKRPDNPITHPEIPPEPSAADSTPQP
jgi:hypothetical protein